MDFEQVVSARRSIRKFDENKKIDLATLEKILTHGTLAPSSKNRQPWYFVILQDDVLTKNKIADIMTTKLATLSDIGPNSIENTAKIIKNAPCCVAVFETFDIFPNSIKQSIGACIENICLSATNYGIGSLWICDMDICPDEIKAHLKVTEPYKLAALVALGYALETPYARPRKSLNEICKFK